MMRSSLTLLSLLFILGGCVQSGRPKRGAPDFRDPIWPIPIPVKIDTSFSEDQQAFIRGVLEKFSAETCIKFEENLPGKQLIYSKAPEGQLPCGRADVGDIRSRQDRDATVEITSECVTNNYIVQHETMHALGFQHTENRHDRDTFVTVNMNLIEDASKWEHTKVSSNENNEDFGIPYEFNSIMHSSPNSFIKLADPDYDTVVGGKVMSFNDWKLLNRRYGCDKSCPTPIDCKNNGYQHPQRCDECVCPEFFNGTLCENGPETVLIGLGKTKRLDYARPIDFRTINTKPHNFTNFEKIPPQMIKAPEGTRIRVSIENMDDYFSRDNFFRELYDSRCAEKGLVIIDGDLTTSGRKFCNKKKDFGHSILTASNVLIYRVYSKPGLDFVLNATFTVEPVVN